MLASASFIEITVTSDHLWSAVLRDMSSPGGKRLGGGTLLNLSTDADGENHLRVVVIGERGWLFVNYDYVATIDLTDIERPGDAAIITGALAGNEVEGASVGFVDFTITELNRRHGPTHGTLEAEPQAMAKHQTDVWTRDLVVESEFTAQKNGLWSYGFIIRETESNLAEAVGVTGRHQWFHETHDVDDTGYTRLADGFVSNVGARVTTSKHLLLIAIDDIGWLFLNGVLIVQLDLSHNPDSGWISVFGDFLPDHQGSPNFEEFRVWVP